MFKMSFFFFGTPCSKQTVYNARYSKIRNACTCKCFNNCVSFSKINYNVKQQPDLHIARS